MKKKGKVFLAIVFILLIALGAGVYYCYSQISPVALNDGQSVRIEIQKGDSTYKIAQKLEDAQLIKNQKFFYYFVRYPKLIQLVYPNEEVTQPIILKSGIYHLQYGLNYAQLVNDLCSGQQEYIKVAIPEGKTISQIGEILEAAGICTKADFKSTCYSPLLLNKYNIPGESAEGFLFPET